MPVKVGKAGTTANVKPWKCTANFKGSHCSVDMLLVCLNIRKHRAWTGMDERFVIVFADLNDRI
jgi:hypothetical protein